MKFSSKLAGALQHYREAVPQAEAYLRRHPLSWRIFPALAHAYVGTGRNQEAWTAMEKCLGLVPPKEWLWMANDAALPEVVDVLSRTNLRKTGGCVEGVTHELRPQGAGVSRC